MQKKLPARPSLDHLRRQAKSLLAALETQDPEAGNTNHGIYRLNQDRLEICLDLHGKPRPSAFRTAPRSGQAYEILTRTTRQRPEGVQGGQPPNPADPTPRSAEPEFAFTDSATLRRLQGTWKPIRMVRSGIELPAAMLRSGVRTAVKNEVTIALGGKVLIHALVRLDETKSPIQIDYFSLAKSDQGAIQLGIMKWVGDEVCFCMAMPGQPRPDEFGSALGSQFLLSQWRRDP